MDNDKILSLESRREDWSLLMAMAEEKRLQAGFYDASLRVFSAFYLLGGPWGHCLLAPL
jgi:hypothetical protein